MRENTTLQPITIKRKCNCCKETIYISKNTIDDAIFYDKKSYHRKCFIDICNKRAKMKRVDVSEKWQWVLKNIERISHESKYHYIESIYKEEINQFILSEYDLTIIPSSVWQKLSNIYFGTFRGMSVGIPPEELIDMWRRKIDYLNRIANQNMTKGKVMNSDQRINYDLSILINKYDGYKKWKESQRVLEQEQREQRLEEPIVMTGNIQNEMTEKNTDDISDLVDDIFG